MLKKSFLFFSLVVSANLLSVESETGNPIQTQQAHVFAENTFMQANGGHTHNHTHHDYSTTNVTRNAGHVKQPVCDNYFLNSLANMAVAGERGIYQGIAEGVGAVVAKKIVDMLHEPADEKMVRTIHLKKEKLKHLKVIREEIKEFESIADGNENLEKQAQQLRLGYGYTLLEFIEQQKKEGVDVITPYLDKLTKEVYEFKQGAQGSDDEALKNLSVRISATYGVLLAKQMEYEKKYNQPSIIVAVIGDR